MKTYSCPIKLSSFLLQSYGFFQVKTCVTALLLVFSPLAAQTPVTFVNETFDSVPLGNLTLVAAPTSDAIKSATQISVVAGNLTGGGAGNVLWYNKSSNATGGNLDYNVGDAPQSTLVLSVDITSNSTAATPAGPVFISLGGWNNTANVTQGAAAARRMATIEYFQGSAGNITCNIRTLSTTVGSFTYANSPSAKQNIKIYANDLDAAGRDYIGPDGIFRTLPANSFAVFRNNILVTMTNTNPYGPLSQTALDVSSGTTVTPSDGGLSRQ